MNKNILFLSKYYVSIFLLLVLFYFFAQNKVAYAQSFDNLNNFLFNKININPALTAYTDSSEFKFFAKNKFNAPTQNSYTGTFEMPIRKHKIGLGLSANYSDFSWNYMHGYQTYEESKQFNIKVFCRKNLSDKLIIGGFIGYVKHDGRMTIAALINSDAVEKDNIEKLSGGIGVVYKKKNWFLGANIKTDNHLRGFQSFQDNNLGLAFGYTYQISPFNIEQLTNMGIGIDGIQYLGIGNLINYKCMYIGINYFIKNNLEISLGSTFFNNRIKLSFGYEFQINRFHRTNDDGFFNSNQQNSISMFNYKF